MPEIFAEEKYIDEKLLLTTLKWCIARVSSSVDAEDLMQDILLHAVSSIRTGRTPNHFYPWYWQLAYNRYCAFLKQKKYGAFEIDEWSEAVYEETDFFKEDEISELNYVISRLSKVQRELVIRYYLRNESVAQIAKEMGIPEGTVKRRLFDTRTDIRNGVEHMEKRIGMSAYAPADLKLCGGYGIPTYWNQINDLMSRQVFVSCMREAKTVQEIADEIGVAPVYFEEKMAYLLENRFLRETAKGKYITDFLIIPRQLEIDFYHERGMLLRELGKDLTALLYASEKDIRAFDFYGNDMPYDYLLWLLYYWACDAMSKMMKKVYMTKWKDKIPEMKERDWLLWGSVCFPDEPCESKESYTISWSNMHYPFAVGGYRRVEYANLFEAPPFLRERDQYITESNIRTVMRIFEDPNADLDEHEAMQIATLIERGYIEKREHGFYLNLPVISTKTTQSIYAYFEEKCLPLAERYTDVLSELADRLILPHVREDLLYEYVKGFISSTFWTYSSVLYYAMNEGKTLCIPEDYERSAADTVIYYKK